MSALERIESDEVMDVGRLVALLLGILILIMDSRVAFMGARDGIDLCIRVVIPSIFPMMFLARLLTGQQFRCPRWLCDAFRLPTNSHSLLITGIFCGFPVGAQLVADAHHHRCLGDADARRMLCVCSNCGPAFLFGMTAELFGQLWVPWVLWVILIVSSGLISWLIPDKLGHYIQSPKTRTSISDALSASVKAMSLICGWVILFRVLLAFWERWLAGWLPRLYTTVLYGLLELSNGCSALRDIGCMGLKFVLCGLFMSFGGACVALQIKSVSKNVDMGAYFPGKAFQSGVCLLTSYFIQLFAFPAEERLILPVWSIAAIAIFSGICAYFLRKTKNSSRIFQTVSV